MDFSRFEFIHLTPDFNQSHEFNCGDADLNDFLLNDALNYQNELLAVTYLLIDGDQTVAFFSLLNDRISISDVESNRK
jgi:hypothetical protein